MREDVKKILFIGLEEDKQSFFEKSQKEGIIHFIDSSATGVHEIPEEVKKTVAAIKVLRGLPSLEQEENFNSLDADKIISSILNFHEQKEKLEEEMRVLNLEIARIQVFGNFSLEDIAFIENQGKCKIRFFCGRPNLFAEEPVPDSLIFIHSEHGLDYYLAIDDGRKTYDKMIEMKIDHSLKSLKAIASKARGEHIKLEHQLKKYAPFNDFLHHSLIEKLNRYHLYNATTYIQQTLGGSLFAVEGWVPNNRMDRLQEVTRDLSVYFEEIAIEPTDVIPTCLENHGLSRLGEDLVRIYDTPSSTDKDPSIWVLFCFTLFFAFIIGDAGYGAVYLALALYLRYYKFPDAKGVGRRVLNLFIVLCVGCVIWGTMMTSFFGMQIALDNPLRKISVVQWLAEKKAAYYIAHDDSAVKEWVKKYPELQDVTDPHIFVSYTSDGKHIILNKLTDNVMFELALFLGVVHLILSLLRYTLRNWHNIGWVAFLIGAYLYFPLYLKTPSFLNFVGGIDLVRGGEIGFQLMLAGIGVAWVLAIIRYGWVGIFEVMVLIQIFADTLSYLRLYALGLAGAIVASTINEIASGMPLFLAVLLIMVSHFVNIILSTMSGIIHGLRLNFLEWYHYSFEGGGKEYQPLRLLKKE